MKNLGHQQNIVRNMILQYHWLFDVEEAKPVMQKLRTSSAHFRKSGARQGVRVVGPNVLSGMQFRRTGGEAEWNSVNMPSLEEAEKFLDSLK